MEKNDREILETWMSAFIDGELDFEGSSLLLEALQQDASFRAEMLLFVCRQKAVQDAIQNALGPLSAQEQANMVVNFWHAVESEAQENHDEEFLQERAYLLAQNVLQGRMRREALDAVAKRDPACVREAAKIIGHMESVRSDLEHQAAAEPLDELRHQTMTQLFGTDANAQVSERVLQEALQESDLQVQATTTLSDEVMATDEGQILSEEEEIIQPPADVPLDSIPPVAMSEGLQQEMATADAANDDGSPTADADSDDDEFFILTPGARVIQLFQKVKLPAAATAIAAAAAIFLMPTSGSDAVPSSESSSEIFAALVDEAAPKADPQWQDRLLAAWQMEMDQRGETSTDALPILNDNSSTEVESLDTKSSNPMVFKTPNKNITVIWIGGQQG